jgi:hypothetical protein
MPKVSDVCRYVRSKAAGPFWESFAKYHDSPSLGADSFAALYGVEARWVKRTPVPDLSMVKVSYPRPTPQGWITERDMHSGQQYVRLLNVELS